VSVSPNEVLGLAVLVATLLIAYFTFRSAQAVERSAQVMERTHKASFASVLRVEFFLLGAGSREDPLYPVFSDITEEHERLQREWRNLPRDQALTRKHAIFVSVKNLGPAVATNVSLFTKVRIVQPNMGAQFTKEAAIDVPILEVRYRQAKLVHVFDEPNPDCRIGIEETRVIHTTAAGETTTEVITGGSILRLINSPIKTFDPTAAV